MSDIKISLDETQVNALRDALTSPPRHWWESENLLRLAQVVALLIGGGWMLTQFLWYQRDEIELKQKELAESVRLKELEVEISGLKRSREARELSSLTTSRYEVAPLLEVRMLRRMGSHMSLYEVTYSVKLENNSGEQFESSLWVLDYFVGTLKTGEEGAIFLKPRGAPSGRWNPGSGIPGAVKWVLAGTDASVFSQATREISPELTDKIIPREDGSLTGVLRPGEKLHYKQSFIVKAEPGSYAAFVSNFCFDRCKNGISYTQSDTIDLPS